MTGAPRGIGAAIARRLSNDGFAVAVNYAGEPDTEAEALVAELQGARAAGPIAVKRRRGESRRRAPHVRDSVEQQLAKVDVLVNNAGVIQPTPLGRHQRRAATTARSTSTCAALSTRCAKRRAA